MSDKKLHLCLVMTDEYFPIYRRILSRTLPKDFDSINILHINDCEDARPGAVGTVDFKRVNYKKLHFIYRQLKASIGDNLLVVDADCVFFGSVKEEINQLLETQDMVFQRGDYGEQLKDTEGQMKYSFDTHAVNVATWALRCSEKNISFFENEIITRAEGLLLRPPEIPKNLTTAEEKINYVLKMGYDKTDVVDEVSGERFFRFKDSEHMRFEAEKLNLPIDESGNIYVPRRMFQWNPETNSMQPFDGDACVVNRSLIEEKHDIKVGELPSTYTSDKEGGDRPDECKLYQSASAGHGVKSKADDMTEAYARILKKISDAGNRKLSRV